MKKLVVSFMRGIVLAYLPVILILPVILEDPAATIKIPYILTLLILFLYSFPFFAVYLEICSLISFFIEEIENDDDNTIINFEYNTYYILTFVIHPINNSLCVFVNDSQENYEYFFKQNYFESKSIDTSISKMIFFKHFYGEVTSIINIKKCLIRTKLWTKRLNENMNMFIEGLYNKKQLTNFLKIIESEDNNTINDIVNMNINMFLKGEEMINFIFVPFNNNSDILELLLSFIVFI